MTWQIERHRDVAVVHMNTNEVNRQNEQFFADLEETLDRLERDHAERPMVLTSAAKVFSAGFDFDYWFPPIHRNDVAAVGDAYHRFKKINQRLFTLARPTVAAINGHAYAGGLITALCCDARLASQGPLRLGLNEVAIGLAMPAHFTEIVRYALGTRLAAEVILRGQLYEGDEAMRLGIVDALVPPERLIDAAVERAAEHAPDSMTAYAFSKRALQAQAVRRLDQDSERLDQEFAGTWCSPQARSATGRVYETLKQRRLDA